MPITILLVAPVAPPAGGIATWTEGLLKFATGDSDVAILHMNSAIRFRSIASASPMARIAAGVVYGAALTIRFFAALLFKDVDVVHICSSASLGLIRDLLLLAGAWAARTPSVLHLRFGRLPALATRQTWETQLVTAACRLASRVVVLDTASLDAVRSLAPRCGSSLIPNPVWRLSELPPAAVAGGGPRTLVFAGHVTPRKGVRELVLACRELREIDFRLELIGPCTRQFREELRSLARAKGDGSWLAVLDENTSSQVSARIADGFATVLPSYTEGFPNVILESMAAGRPVIATPVGAIPQILAEGGADPCGICVAVRDVDALTSAIRFLLQNPERGAELGRCGWKRVVRDYSPETIYPLYRSLWASCASESAKAVEQQLSRTPLPVLLIAPTPPPPGGIATWAEGLRKYASLDRDVVIHHLDSAIRFRAIENTSLPTRAAAGSLYSCMAIASFAFSSAIRGRAAIVHICSSGSLGLVRDLTLSALSRLYGRPVIMHFHFGRLPSIAHARNWEATLVRAACKFARCAVVLDSASAGALRSISPNCCVAVIPNPAWDLAELKLESRNPAGAKRLLFVGHVTPAKGVRELVEACCQIKTNGFRLHLVGPIKLTFRKELQELARTRADGDWLTITGPLSRKEALSLIAGSFAVILPSYAEGFPITLIEAMAFGKPVIATRVGAIPEMLQPSGEEACGICVEPHDSDSLRSAILGLLEQPSRALQLGSRGRVRVYAKYAPELIYPLYRSLWQGAPVRTSGCRPTESVPAPLDPGATHAVRL